MRLAAALLAMILVPAPPAAAITPGQVDTFADGTVQNWTEGLASVTPPTNVAGGGPAGAGDAYLRNTSTGVEGQAGGKLVCYNLTQWKGNYIVAGVTHIQVDLANFGATDIQARIAFDTASDTTKYCSPAVLVPASSGWRTVTFDLANLILVPLSGELSREQFLAKVKSMRILSAAAPEFRGDLLEGDMGIDNVTAVAGGTPAAASTWGRVKARFR